MSEHMFSHGPDSLPNRRQLAVLERVAKRHGLTVATYPSTCRSRWGFHGPELGRFEAFDLEEIVRDELDTDPIFHAWNRRT